MCKLLPLLKPKIPKYREPNKRNAKGSSIATNYYSSRGKKNLYKSKKIVQNFAHMLRCMIACSNYSHANAKAWVFPDHFCSHSFTNRSKNYIRQQVIMYITIFVSLSLKSWFKPAICCQNVLESPTIFIFFMAVVRTKTSSPESWKDSLPLDPPF